MKKKKSKTPEIEVRFFIPESSKGKGIEKEIEKAVLAFIKDLGGELVIQDDNK